MAPGFFARGGGWVVAQFVLLPLVIIPGPLGRGSGHPAAVAAGGALGLTGLVLIATAARAMKQHLTPLPDPNPDAPLLDSGVYGRVRHPMYAGLVLMSAGWALGWASTGSGLAAVALALVLNQKARREERRLREVFPGYAAYAVRVPRWGVGRRREG